MVINKKELERKSREYVNKVKEYESEASELS